MSALWPPHPSSVLYLPETGLKRYESRKRWAASSLMASDPPTRLFQ